MSVIEVLERVPRLYCWHRWGEHRCDLVPGHMGGHWCACMEVPT